MKRIYSLLFVIYSLSSRAEDFKLNLALGGMAFETPRYEGGAVYEPYFLPMIDIDYGPVFVNTLTGAGLYIPANAGRNLIFSPAIRWRSQRSLGENLESIRPTASLNTILKFGGIMFNLRISDSWMADNRGGLYNLGFVYQNNNGEKIKYTIYSTLMFGSQKYNQVYYGITPAESAEFGFAPWNAPGGLKSVDVGGIMSYFINPHWSLDFRGEYLRITDLLADSPVVAEKNQFLLGVGASWHY